MSDDAFAARIRQTPLDGVTSGADRLHGLPQIPDHELIRPIGRGSYGVVWLARSVMGTYRAVKIIYRHTFKEAHPFEREYNGIRKFEPVSRSHEGLMRHPANRAQRPGRLLLLREGTGGRFKRGMRNAERGINPHPACGHPHPSDGRGNG